MMNPPAEIVDALRRADQVLVLAHVYPDGDAIGSLLALADTLEGMGKKVRRYVEEEIAAPYRFLPGSDRIEVGLPDLSSFDCAVALDCGDRFRLGKAMEQLLTVTPFVVIDHHAGHKQFGDLSWVESQRASTGEMVYDLIRAFGREPSREAAYCLYAAIVSDTGSFKYSSTTADTFRIAQELIRQGVKPSEVANELFDNFTVNRLHLLKAVLDTLELHAGGRLAVISARREIFTETGTTQADAENFINYPRSIATVQIAVFIKENPDGKVAVSLRSKGVAYDVAQLAAGFGGGGHRNAAGFKMADTSLAAVREKVLQEAESLLGRAG